MLEIFGYLAALLIGVILGVMGGGGSIITVPVLVYIMHFSPVVATGYSLFVVGSTSAVGAAMYWRRGLVQVKTAISFGVPTAISVYLTRQFLVPAIPEVMFKIGVFSVTKGLFLMLLFAILMILASISMIRKRKDKEGTENRKPPRLNYLGITIQGLAIGLLTGLVGVGGGFMIVPALVILLGIDMKVAVGTSLLIMAANSLTGFLGDIFTSTIEWSFLLVFASISIVGIFIGNAISRKVDGDRLKQGFGWFILIMGFFIIIKELWL